MTLESIANWFQEADFKWKFKDGFRVPMLDDLDEAVTKAIDRLSDADDLTQIEFGRLIVQRNGNAYDVYVQMAEFPIED